MKKQITDFLKGAAEHHISMAKAHQTAADGYEADGYEPASHELAFHKAAMDSHTTMADACLAACKVLQNADASDFGKFERDFSQAMPTGVSLVAPDTPQHARTVRAVPRHGAPPASSVPDVSPEFQKLFSLDDGS